MFKKLYILHFIFCIACFHSSAQTVSATLDRDKILIGEQVTLTLKLENVNAPASINTWFNLPDTINHIEVIKRENIDTINLDGSNSFIQKITLTSFDSGKWQLPVLQIAMKDSVAKLKVLKATPISLEVLPVDVSGMNRYHDIKDIIEVKAQNNLWQIIAIIFGSVLIIVFFIWWFLKRRKKKIDQPKMVVQSSLYELTIKKLDELQKENLPAKNQTKLFYTRLDDICRNYFDKQLNIGAAHSTTDEMMIRLKDYLQPENIRTEFYQLLRLTAAVKFAKYLSDETQNNEAIFIAKKTIQQLHQSIQEKK
ncbi:MAG: BatD family protein [Chitinophagaceae bacterium]